ncbi:MAG: hypothetical protein CVU46_00975 [Chloroflexi bacterium HGW-Chloroflexi-8]|nr:MAG: hypothetical protein CVU46_00975 [Chloroflexi bacterium HGW-Chloroflexi-8]
MNDEQADNLRTLLNSRNTAALGTLHSGAPYVSMVPFAILKDVPAFIIHVSRLAAHTQDMLVDPRVSLLISGIEQAGLSPLAIPRITLLGTAYQLALDAPEYPTARKTYLTRFPDAASLFSLGDFSLFMISPKEARWIAGFAQARSLTLATFARVIKDNQD